MAALLCPILVGRDEPLALADCRLSAARSGTGHLLFLAGEAGIGKTRLLGSTAGSARTTRSPFRAGRMLAAGTAAKTGRPGGSGGSHQPSTSAPVRWVKRPPTGSATCQAARSLRSAVR